MSELDLSTKTVIQLRKIAKEMGVTLGAGISKAGIIAKLEAAMETGTEAAAPMEAEALPPVVQEASAAPTEEAPAPVPTATLIRPSEAPVQAPSQTQAQPQFRAAWHNPSPRYGTKPAYQAPSYPQPQQQPQPQPYAGRAAHQADAPRTMHTRPTGYTPRFGPAAQEQHAESVTQQEPASTIYRAEQPRYGYGTERRGYDAPARPSYDRPQHGYDAASSYEPAGQPAPAGYDNGYNRGYNNRPAYHNNAPRRDTGYYHPELGTTNPAVGEMLAAGECAEGQGVLEIHPDGYGFLRSETLLSSSRDIYVSMAQIRRFGLRTGDFVVGKTRPQRDGDKYTAMLYITEINGIEPDALSARPVFDELTPIYPSRRINLEVSDPKYRSMRLIDLIAPLGFGQRGLLLCPPDTGKTQLLQDFANVIAQNHPDATVMVLLIDENPEDVTLFREQVSCPVLASTFDQSPENHLRLTDMVLERAQRLVEQGGDVIIIVDSLTRLAKVYTSSAAQQGRGTPGMVNPSSLFRAKKLFGAARCTKEGGSLTIIGAMNIETTNKVDDSIVLEFHGTANMELLLDASVARAGISPALNLRMSGTKRAEALLNPQHLEGLQLMRSIISSSRSATAIPQLMSMMDVAETNDELLVKIKDWNQMMDQSSR